MTEESTQPQQTSIDPNLVINNLATEIANDKILIAKQNAQISALREELNKPKEG